MKALVIVRWIKIELILCLMVLFSPTSLFADTWIYTTSKGDTIWDFSQKYLHHVGYWQRVKAINNITHPKRLQPNQSLRVPLSWVKVNPIHAEVLAVFGVVELKAENDPVWKNVEVGQRINLGDRISTHKAANVTIRFADNSRLTLHENSEAEFDLLSAYGDSGMVDSRIRMRYGRVDSRVKPALGPGSRFEIHTPSAISAVRGTEYRLSSNPQEQTTHLEVLEGKVKIAAEKHSRLISQGYGSRVKKGQAPMIARQLLPAPQMTHFPEPIRTLNHLFQWEPVNQAKQYRVEIATHQHFDQIRWGRVVDGHRVNLPDLPDGRYFIRVRAIDELGLEGVNQTANIHLDVRPQAPILLSPNDGKVFRNTPNRSGPELRWSDSSDAHRYQLQIASDKNFSQIIQQHDDWNGLTFSTSDLDQIGSYYWRLASIASDGEMGPYSPAKSFEIKPVPAQPNTQMAVDDEQISLSWQAGLEGQSYEIQLAEDETFEQLLAHEVTKQPQWTIEQENLIVRYFRVRVIESDGYQGAWSATQKIDPPQDDWIYLFIPASLLIFLL